MPLLLGLSSALCWGTADFLGGLQAKRLAAVSVTLWSQLAGGVALLAVLLVTSQEFDRAGVAWGAAAGLFTGAGLVLFYRGLATGQMALVAPISACAAVVPLAVSVVRGDAPSALESAGIALALLGVVIVSRPVEDDARGGRSSLPAIGMALGAALGFGMFYVLVGQGSATDASPLWVIAGARGGSVGMVLAVGLFAGGLGRPGHLLPALILTGVLDTSANVLFAYATLHGNLAIVSVFGSLYPVVTVALAAALTSERMTAVRLAGAGLALGGVAFISAA